MKKVIAILTWLILMVGLAAAEEQEAWIMCQPDSYVNARWSPRKNGAILGRLELGEKVLTDGETKNGYLHCYGLTFESDEGWIHAGYIVYDEPRITEEIWTVDAGGRTACRRYVDGPRRCWAKNHSEMTVFAVSEEWSLTSKGFVRTKFIRPKEDAIWPKI